MKLGCHSLIELLLRARISALACFHLEIMSGEGAKNVVAKKKRMWWRGSWAQKNALYDENNLIGIQLIDRFGFSQVRLLFKEGVKPTMAV